jgi:RNA recognition motif. (a.k.a. RRM, RBD, or RNP domain)
MKGMLPHAALILVPHAVCQRYSFRLAAEYFSQFGTITKLRLSRNKKTGNSKHYAFLEFQSLEVARIAAEAMDGYMFFGQKLQVL